MANINTDTGRKKGGKRNKPQQKTLRVDFTPMVDMLMLLITFFMFCTTLAVPQAMDIVMPSDQKDDNPPEVVGSKTITLILGENNKVYYYHGVPNYEDYSTLVEANYKDKKKNSRNSYLRLFIDYSYTDYKEYNYNKLSPFKHFMAQT